MPLLNDLDDRLRYPLWKWQRYSLDRRREVNRVSCIPAHVADPLISDSLVLRASAECDSNVPDSRLLDQ